MERMSASNVLKRNSATHLPNAQNIWNGEVVEEFKEDVSGKRAKIHLMTPRNSKNVSHGLSFRTKRSGHRADG